MYTVKFYEGRLLKDPQLLSTVTVPDLEFAKRKARIWMRRWGEWAVEIVDPQAGTWYLEDKGDDWALDIPYKETVLHWLDENTTKLDNGSLRSIAADLVSEVALLVINKEWEQAARLIAASTA